MIKIMTNICSGDNPKKLLYFFQMSDVINNEYLKEYVARVESMDDYDTFILGKFPCLMEKMKELYKKTINDAVEEEIETHKKIVKEEVMAALPLHGQTSFAIRP